MQFNLDEFLADPVRPYEREKWAYRLQDGSIVKFSTFNPNRGQRQSEGQVIRFFDADVVYHAPGFYQRYKPVTEVDKNFKGQKADLENDNQYYQGIVAEVIELTGEFDENTPPRFIELHFAQEWMPSTVVAWMIHEILRLGKIVSKVEYQLEVIKHDLLKEGDSHDSA